MAHRVKKEKVKPTNVHEQSQTGNWSEILKSKKQYQHHKSTSPGSSQAVICAYLTDLSSKKGPAVPFETTTTSTGETQDFLLAGVTTDGGALVDTTHYTDAIQTWSLNISPVRIFYTQKSAIIYLEKLFQINSIL